MTYRRTKTGEFSVNLGASFPSTIVEEIEFLAEQHGHSKARVVRELALRGLAAYRRDGRLSELTGLADSECAAMLAMDTTMEAGGPSVGITTPRSVVALLS